MELKQGYKQTEVGVIPEDWEVKKLCDISILKSGKSITSTRIFETGEYKCFGGNGLRGYADSFTHDGSFPLIGRQGALCGNVNYINGKFFASEHAVVVTVSKKVDPKWMSYVLNRMNLNQYSESSAQPGLSVNKISILPIAFPISIAEQTAIATALSDIDELISQTEKLIEKKKAIKQGVMQELLKPKEGWVTKRISEVCWFQEGPGVRKHQFTQSGVKLLNGTNIQEGKLDLENTNKFISEDEAFGLYSHFLVDENDILIACSGVSIDKFHEKVTVAKVFHLPLCMNTSTMRFKVKKGYLDQGYFIQFLKSKRFKEQISGKATGSAQLNFGPSHVTMVEINLPGIEIQNTIGQVLSDMEMEIRNFELKLKKLIFQKQGMMQALLTGKIRLI